MTKDYYGRLGITINATKDQIRAAFRRRSKELHPDVSGTDSGPFVEIQEAYAVLSDPDQRRLYDRQHVRAAPRRAPWGPAPEPSMVRKFRHARSSPGVQVVSLTESFGGFYPSFEELFDRLWSNFATIERPKPERLEGLSIEVVVTPEEALSGGSLRIQIPGRATCPVCGGCGGGCGFVCGHCAGQGAFVTEYPVDVTFPAGLRDGHVTTIPLNHLGIHNFYLAVILRVSGSTYW